MNKVILFVQVSLDGFFEGPKKEIDWHMVDDELHAHFNGVLKAMGAFLGGRVTWDEDPHLGGLEHHDRPGRGGTGSSFYGTNG